MRSAAVTVARVRALWGAALLAVAAPAGRVVRGLSTVPGICGAGLVAYGAGQMYRPLLFITAGVFLLLVDRRMP